MGWYASASGRGNRGLSQMFFKESHSVVPGQLGVGLVVARGLGAVVWPWPRHERRWALTSAASVVLIQRSSEPNGFPAAGKRRGGSVGVLVKPPDG